MFGQGCCSNEFQKNCSLAEAPEIADGAKYKSLRLWRQFFPGCPGDDLGMNKTFNGGYSLFRGDSPFCGMRGRAANSPFILATPCRVFKSGLHAFDG